MKTDRFFSVFTPAAVILLAGLLLTAGRPAGAQGFTYRFGKKDSAKVDARQVAGALALGKVAAVLARQVREVQKRLESNRRALGTVRGPDGKPAYLRQDVASLIDGTGKDLDQAILQIREPGLDALRAWSAMELQRIREELAATPVQTAALFPGLDTPRAVAVVASLGGRLPLPGLAYARNTAAPRQETLTPERTDSLLDQVGELVGRIFFLADTDDLEVKLWVGSTPKEKARFQFWPQGGVDAASAAAIIQTAGNRDHVLRGLYAYRADWTQGQVTKQIQFSSGAAASMAPAANLPSQRLDLVNGTSFFCCRFNQKFCHHVASKKECRD